MKQRLNLGCGTDIKEGYINIDKIKSKGVDKVFDLDKYPYLLFEDNSVDEVYASNIVEHLDDIEKFFKEIARILKPGGILHIIVPHFTSPCSNSEFHKRRTWYWSYTSKRLSRTTSSEIMDLYEPFEDVSRKIKFIKRPLFWNYLIEWIINLHPVISCFYEHTGLCYLFPAHMIDIKLRKKCYIRR